MTELNDNGREIWFRRFFWSYMPAHWKGVVFPVPIVLATILLCHMALTINPLLDIPVFLIGWASVMWMCERHSPSRR